MADNTGIEWVRALARAIGAIPATWNTIDGCSRQSEGCRNCWAADVVHRRLSRSLPQRYAGLTELDPHGVPRFNGTVRLHERSLAIPLSARKRRVYFAPSMADPFHPALSDADIDRIMAVMALCPQHVFLLLTKRPERAAEYLSSLAWPRVIEHCRGATGASVILRHSIDSLLGAFGLRPRFSYERDLSAIPLPNVFIGCTVEDQPTADDRHPHMQAIAAAGWRTFVSYEPALGPFNPSGWEFLSWLISGGETGANSRPSLPDWFRDTRDWCAEHGIPYLHKQNGDWGPGEVCGENPTRTEKTADWLNGAWRFSAMTPRAIREQHIDDEPDVYRVGWRRTGRWLDGRVHDGVPALPGRSP